MPRFTSRQEPRLNWCAALAATAVLLTGCVQDKDARSGGANAGGSSVEFGASKADWEAALKDVDAEELTVQSVSTPGQGASVPIEAFKKEVEDVSGGKVKIKVVYGNSIAAPEEAPQALADGRMDIDYIYPLYDPARYPANAAFADMAFIGDHRPVSGTVSTFAGMLQAGMQDDGLAQELEDEGMKMLMPFTPNTSVGLMCTKKRTSLADFKGAQIRVSGTVQAEEIKALGAVPVSLPYSEQYQALQRGTIDCTASAAYAAVTLGTIPLAPHFTSSDETGLNRVAAPYVIGLDKWESLPLPVQQLIWDKMMVWADVMLEQRMLVTSKLAVDTMVKEGGEVNQFDDDAAKALDDLHSSLLENLGKNAKYDGAADLAAAAQEDVEKWSGVVEKSRIDSSSFSDYAKADSPEHEVSSVVTQVWEEVMNEHRPK